MNSKFLSAFAVRESRLDSRQVVTTTLLSVLPFHQINAFTVVEDLGIEYARWRLMTVDACATLDKVLQVAVLACTGAAQVE